MFIDVGKIFPALRALTFNVGHHNVIQVQGGGHGDGVGIGHAAEDDLIALLHYLHQLLAFLRIHVENIWNTKNVFKKCW